MMRRAGSRRGDDGLREIGVLGSHPTRQRFLVSPKHGLIRLHPWTDQ